MRRGVATMLTALMAASGGCADVPPDRYGVQSLRFEGVERMGEESLRQCLATRDRDRFGIRLGFFGPGSCTDEPFDVDRPSVALWPWPWTEWPLYDETLLELDADRIERWYAARGYHQARVVETTVSPQAATGDDTLDPDDPSPGCERIDEGEGCTVDVTIRVEEGEPTHVSDVSLTGHEDLPADLRQRVEEALDVSVGDRFDESSYDGDKEAIRDVLRSAGYALAEVEGTVRVDRPARRARIDLRVDAGPESVFGEVTVEGAEGLPVAPIREATLIEAGDPYRHQELMDAQQAVYGLGSFSSVLVEPVLPDEGNVVDVRVEVTPARESSFGLGAGVQSGVLQRGRGLEQISVPQWDVHLVARYEDRNFLGGLRQLTIEERPRMIVLEPFPRYEMPRFGNEVSIELRQPGFLEPRLEGVVGAAHEIGPDPFDIFFRHRIDSHVGVERGFFGERLFTRLGLRNSIYRVPSGEVRADGSDPPADHMVTFLEQQIRLDLRDDRQRPHGGALLQLGVHEAGYVLPSSWDYLRLTPDARAYLPLPLRITLAARFAVGMYFIHRADEQLDALSQQLGPRDFRLRGGGAGSNRGFLPGRLGDGLEGGQRRWEASLELRVPVTTSFGTVLFADAGDVSRGATFRFDHPQTSVGWGLRYFTLVGAIRLDLAWRVPGLQVMGGEDERDPGATPTLVDLGLLDFPGAVHITLGESF